MLDICIQENSEEEREHGMKLMDYQVMRGGRVVFQDISKPAIMEWGSALQAVEATLELEKTVRVLYFHLKVLSSEMDPVEIRLNR